MSVTRTGPAEAVAQLLEILRQRPEVRRLAGAVENSEKVLVEGVIRPTRGPLWAALRGWPERPLSGPTLWVTPSSDGADTLVEDLRALGLGSAVVHFPYRDQATAVAEGRPVDPMQLKALEALQQASPEQPLLVVAPVRAILQKTMSREALEANRWTVRRGETTDRDTFLEMLVAEGYQRTGMVERRGEFSARGDIIDIYPITGEPVRVELFGDDVESIRLFNLDTQRSIMEIEEFSVSPIAHEDAGSHMTDFLPRGSLVCLEEPAQLRLQTLEWSHEGGYGEWGDFLALLTPFRQLSFTSWDSAGVPGARATEADPEANPAPQATERLVIPFEPQRVFPDRVDGMMARLPQWVAEQRTVLLMSRQASRLEELLTEANLRASELAPGRGVVVLAEPLAEGFTLPGVDGPTLEVLTDREITGAIRRRKSHQKADRASLIRLEELNAGDMVVHLQHGIGRYGGVKTLVIAGFKRDFLTVEYAKGDSLFVPVEQLDLLQPYKGLEGREAKLSKMGGQDWTRTRSKVKKDAAELAEELLRLYAERESSVGHAYPPDTPWQREMEEAFPYEETSDQLRVIEEVKSDMERPRPMDRLVCGDVGYGKTEVAIRAAFKAVSEGRQVAVLVPTTVLAHQHFQTFSERLAAFPVRLALLSRFRSKAEVKAALEGLAEGNVDIVIGTHRLLSKDVKFNSLGLLIVDEEQRFGVKQKEKIKGLRKNVDILTLTATPIPRTLNMALVSIRDMSVIETPPEDRVPIKTYLFESHPDILRGAITRELQREGQVYLVHNRVDDIERLAADIRRMLPTVRVAVGHGQMGDEELEKVMMGFLEGEFDVLVCTTIIESGLDIPNANTIIINNAHHFGLAQLYQMRGRVGRSARQAYCYLLYPPSRALSDDALKRLETIRDFTHLGAGYQIALRDLEIRGAGDILGAEQSGSIAAVGFDLYCKMLADAVATLRGEAPRFEVSDQPIVIELPVPANLPDDYVSDGEQKVVLYKKIASVQSFQALEEVRAELVDRFGKLPEEAENLLAIVDLKLRARDLTIPSIRVKEGRLTFLTPFIEPLTLKRENDLYRLTGWRTPAPRDKIPQALVLTGLHGVAAGKPEYPPASELLSKVKAVLVQLQRWKDG
jgi:transcription-repair coupling factor (superfamily II helicase)